MAKPKKVAVQEAGQGPQLKHNPFGALSGLDAPRAELPEPPVETPEAPPAKVRGRLVLRREKMFTRAIQLDRPGALLLCGGHVE